ncbi:chaperone SurA [Microbulbifer aestuariivivens]|uniref:peptidylprolyl isomerase n=1 Tax=Microbulbifer aestuariivivens TaxID=1908308 RepID=A0ABP9WN08_9GAMM
MSQDKAIQFIELPPNGAAATPSNPVMPSACETGGCGCSTGGASTVVPMPAFAPVFVNGVEIAEENISREMQHHPAENGEAAWHQAARALAVRELLLQTATALDIEAESEAGERSETEEDAKVRALLDRELPAVSISEQECRRYYDGHTHRFHTPELFEAAHILIEPEEDTDEAWQAARQQAQALATEIGDDQDQFATAARELSGCPTGQQDGSLGQVRRGELDRVVQQALEALTEGSTAREPVRSRYGWHVVRLHRRIEGKTLPFDLVREKILDMLEARAWVTSASQYIAELSRTAQIEGVQLAPLDTFGSEEQTDTTHDPDAPITLSAASEYSPKAHDSESPAS